MLNFIKNDFSKEAKFKEELFSKMKVLYEKSLNGVVELSDDELNLVFAATDIGANKLCPFINKNCENCENYIINNDIMHRCKIGCNIKD